MNDRIIDMLRSTDKEIVELGIFSLLQEPLRPAEVNVYLQQCINNNFYYYWRVDPQDGEPLIVLKEHTLIGNAFIKDPTRTLKLHPIKTKDYDEES